MVVWTVLCEYTQAHWIVHFKWGIVWDVNCISIKWLENQKLRAGAQYIFVGWLNYQVVNAFLNNFSKTT